MTRVRAAGIYLAPLFMIYLVAGCPGTPQGDPESGRILFRMMHCDGCHGPEGIGGRAPAIGGTGMGYRRFVGRLRDPDSVIMPSFGRDRLSDQDVADILAWLKTRPRHR
jgi:mono/diheme cytochrome c family protein